MTPNALKTRLERQRAGKDVDVHAVGSLRRPDGEGPRGAHPMADIRRIARGWFGRAELGEADRRFESRGLPPVETLSATASDLGLDVAYASRSLRSLETSDFPCVAIMKDGTSRVILAKPDRSTFEIEVAGRRETVHVKDLEADYAGTIFFVTPQPPEPAAEPAPAARSMPRAEAPARPGPAGGAGTSGLIGQVAKMTMENPDGLFRKLIVAAVISNLLLLALPLFTMAVYDRVIPHLAMETLWALAIGVMVALAVDFAIRYTRLKLVDALALSISLSLQAKMYRKVLQVRMAQAPRTSGGLATHVREVDAICQTMPPLLVALMVDVPFFVLIVALLAFLAGPVAVAPVIGVIALLAVSVFAHLHTRKTHIEAATLARAQANQMIETVSALEWVKTSNAQTPLLRQWERVADESSYASHHGRLWAALGTQAAMTITQVVVVLVVLIGVYQIGAGAMTVGALAASTLIVGRAIGPIGTLITLLDKLLHLHHTVESLETLMNAPAEKGGDPSRGADKRVTGAFDLSEVGFAYPGEGRPQLQGVTLSIKPGEKIAFIGRVGSGKSTLLKLFPRLVEPTSGAMLADGRDIRQASPTALRHSIGFMRQDAILFDDTLHANLTFGLEDVSPKVFETAVRVSGVKDFAARHPQGYSMRVGPRGERLSGGERACVLLARALMTAPNILVLDEPTAAMDNTLEARIVRELSTHCRDMTLLVATHRAPILQLVDRVVWVEQGRVVADGPRDEILKRLGQGAAA